MLGHTANKLTEQGENKRITSVCTVKSNALIIQMRNPSVSGKAPTQASNLQSWMLSSFLRTGSGRQEFRSRQSHPVASSCESDVGCLSSRALSGLLGTRETSVPEGALQLE